ncbi:putative nucleic acid-binding protein [Helianthus annuus]|nr:putative nucleic acid-binding protein [Helianthus annuus]
MFKLQDSDVKMFLRFNISAIHSICILQHRINAEKKVLCSYVKSIDINFIDIQFQIIKMEPPAITLLNNLDLNVDNFTIRIRIVRLWTRADFNNARKVYCYDMIVMDSEGTKMQAFVLAKNATEYQHLLEEKRCLTI